MAKTSRNLTAIREAVNRLVNRGADVGLRNGYGAYGLSTRDESRDLSPLLPPAELRTFMDGFEAGWNARDNRGRQQP